MTIESEMPVHLHPWDKQPTTCRFLAVFLGEKARLLRFLHQWFCLNGSLDVLAAPLDPGALPWHTRQAGEFALAVSLGTQPAYYLIGWWLDQSDWRVFYQPGADNEPKERATGEFKPSGCYWPWGVAVGASAAPPYGTRLHLESGVIVNLPPAQSFQNAFSLFKELRAVVFAPSGPQPGVEAKVERLGRGAGQLLPVRLIQEVSHQRPLNPDADIARLEREINRMQENLDFNLRWKDEPEIKVSLYIYPETAKREGGSVWDLRDWFASAPDHALRQFKHARVVVEPLGALHLVQPENFLRKPTAILPRPQFRLQLDWRWKRKGRNLFVPVGWELTPPPPEQNQHAENLLAECLWQKADSLLHSLNFVRTPEGEEWRFTVGNGEFCPLAEQVETLNLQIGIRQAERKYEGQGVDGVERMLNQFRGNLERHLGEHATALRALLDGLWSGERADLDGYREQVRTALDQVQEIKALQQKAHGLKQQQWDTWEAFCREVNQLDAALLPSAEHALPNQLAELDEFRQQLANLWKLDSDEKRKALAQSLRNLAERVENKH